MNNIKSEKAISLLIIEDSDDDVILLLRDLQKSGYSVDYNVVQSKEEIQSALNNGTFDVVISDYNLPKFNGIEALKLIKEMECDIPFILVSGEMGEELAVEAMREGASDYIMKSSLKRLVPAIERELKDYHFLKSADLAKQKSIALSLEAEVKRTEAIQLMEKASKMASIGIITSAITHEINQPLNAIKLGAEGIVIWDKKNDNVLPETIVNMIRKISEAANKIDEIVKHMRLLITDEDKVEMNLIDLNMCIISAVTIISNKLASQEITLDFESDSSNLYVNGNNLQLELVINNLIQNAAQSILENNNSNGKIIIRTAKKDDKIVLTISDNGNGLPPVPIKSLFDPLFSTKKHKGGSGLGLAIVDRFLSKINAEISAANNIDSGATFTVIFNAHEGEK